jgi:predicted DNA-binding protein
MGEKIHVQAPDKIHRRLENASERTGLTKSEMVRDGVLKKLRELEE